jgi:hypothetical protein
MYLFGHFLRRTGPGSLHVEYSYDGSSKHVSPMIKDGIPRLGLKKKSNAGVDTAH